MSTFLFLAGGVGFLISIIFIIVNIIRRKKTKKPLIAGGVCIFLFIVSLSMPTSTPTDNSVASNKKEPAREVTKTETKEKQKESLETKPVTTEKKVEPKKDDNKITYENFLSIRMNQSYEEAKSILGEGTENSSSEIGGMSTKMYTWKGKGISNMNMTIQDGVVVGKAQFGLNKNNSGITLEKYNSVNEGMTLEEVNSILGEGGLTSQTQIMDLECSIYSWANKDGSNCDITFQGGVVNMKAQFGLK